MRTLRGTLLVATTLAGMAAMQPALAQDAQRIDSIESQIQQLQQELRRMRSEMAARDRELRAAQSDAARARLQAPLPQASGQSSQPGQPGGSLTVQDRSLPSGTLSPDRAGSGAGQSAGTTGPGGCFRVGGVTLTV